MSSFRYKILLIVSLVILSCDEDAILPDKEVPLKNSPPFDFKVAILKVFHDRGIISWGPIYDADLDPLYHTVYLGDNLVLERSTADSILTIRNLKPLTEYHGKVLVTDDINAPLEVLFSFKTRKYWLTFDRVYRGHDGNGPAGFSAALTSDGGYVIAGQGAYADESGIYVVKLDSLGFEQWHTINKSYRRGDIMSGTVSQTSDGGYIVASQESLLRLDDNGNALWQVIDQSQEHYFYLYNFNTAVETEDHGFLVAGCQQKSNKEVKAILTKFSAAGQIQWKKEFGTEGITITKSIAKSMDGNFLILGSSLNYGFLQRPMVTCVTPAGNILWTKIYDNQNVYDFPEKIKSTTDGGYIFVSTYRTQAFRGYAKVIKIDSAGEVLWEKVFEWNPYETSAYGIAQVDDGYIVSGNNGDPRPSAGLLFKINHSGDLVWKKEFRPTNFLDYNWIIRDVFKTADNGFFAMGSKSFVYTSQGKEVGLWILKMDDEGNVVE